MQVTRANFDYSAPEILRLIETCDFFAMDQEMTGIEVGVAGDSPLETLEQVYPRKAAAASTYNAFQIGICLFHAQPKTIAGVTTYTARPFNFWLRPPSHRRTDVVLNMSAIDFLLSNGMDFQFWLSQGLPYADLEAEEKERAYHLAFQNPQRDLGDAARDWVQRTATKLASWCASTTEEESISIPDRHVSVEADFELWHELKRRGLSLIAEPGLLSRTPPYARGATSYRRASADELSAQYAAAEVRASRAFTASMGFRTIYSALKTRPMVGHNFSSDLMFLLKMHEKDLPPTLSEFKAAVTSSFAVVFDTKTLATVLPQAPFDNTSLEPLFKELDRTAGASGVAFDFPLGFEAYAPEVVRKAGSKSTSVAHQAAYDAYMTGVVYLRFVHQYGVEQVNQLKNRISVFGSPLHMQLDSAVDPYANAWTCRLDVPPVLSSWTRREVENALLSPALKAEREKNPKAKLPFRLHAVPSESQVFVVTALREDQDLVTRAAEAGLILADLKSWRGSNSR